MAEKRAILANPIANLDADGRLVRLHCGTPGENCQLDQAKDKKKITWGDAVVLMIKEEYNRSAERIMASRPPGYSQISGDYSPDWQKAARSALCAYCFGGEGDE